MSAKGKKIEGERVYISEARQQHQQAKSALSAISKRRLANKSVNERKTQTNAQDLADSLGAAGVVLNNKLPMKCAVSPCEFDHDLTFWNWQRAIIDAITNSHERKSMLIFQDEEAHDVWSNEVGCGHDDLIVFDWTGKIYKYLPTKENYEELANQGKADNVTFVEQDLLTQEGYENVERAVREAQMWEKSWCKPKHKHSGSSVAGGGQYSKDNTSAIEGLLFIMFAFIFIVCAGAAGKKCINERDEAGPKFKPLTNEDDDDDFDFDVEMSAFDNEEVDEDEEVGDDVINALREAVARTG